MEAVSSSSIEGTNSTLDELLEVEEEDYAASDAAAQVRDYALALEAVLPQAKLRGREIFDLTLVRSLHVSTMRSDSSYKDEPGNLRERVVWIGHGNIAHSTFNPPAPKYVQACLEQSIAYLRSDGLQLVQQDFVTRMAIAHAHFEAIHPFRDGNGRVGRLMLPIMMVAEGHEPIYLSPYIEANKQRYGEALKAAQQRLDYSPLTTLMADAIAETVEELKRLRNDLRELQDDWKTRTKFRGGSAALLALDILPEYPVITIRRLESLLGVSYPAASSAVEKLVEVGILREKTGYSRNRIFTAQEAIDLINRPFGEDHDYAGPKM